MKLPPASAEEYVARQRDANVLPAGPNGYDERARKRARILLQMAPTPESILDVGCRSGAALLTFEDRASAGTRVVGLDIVPEFLENARDDGLEVVEGNAESIPFGDAEFKWLFCSHTLEHTLNLQNAWKELRRVAADGIFLVLPLESRTDAFANPGHYHYGAIAEEWLEQLGLHRPWGLCFLQVQELDLILVYRRILRES